jgi:intein/homing endonuclease
MGGRDTSKNAKLMRSLSTVGKNGQQLPDADRVAMMRQLALQGGIDSLEPLLPGMLNLDGYPYSLRDYQPFGPMFRLLIPKSQVWVTGRQVSKTVMLGGEQRVLLSTGQRVRGEDLVVGDQVISIDNKYFAVTGTVLKTVRTEPKPILHIKTRMGTVLDIAETHPLLKLSGWTVGAELRVGDRVAALRRGGSFGQISESFERIVATAYLIGDGHMTTNLGITKQCSQVLEEFSAIIETVEQRKPVWTVKKKTTAVRINASSAAGGCVRRWMEADGLLGKYAFEKFVPDWVFSLSKQDTTLFVSRLWATDGMSKTNTTGCPALSYCSTSQRLAFDVKSLLLKFGIPSSVTRIKAGYKKKNGEFKRCHDAYIVRVETRNGWQTFFDTFDVPGKPRTEIPQTTENNNRDTVPIEVSELIADIAARFRHKKAGSLATAGLRVKPKYCLSYAKARKYLEHFQKYCADHPRLGEFERLLDGNLIWDEITSIEKTVQEPCWDIEVTGEHNYVLDGIVSHNSTSIASRGVLLCNAVPNFKMLYITPLYEQIRRFSHNYVRKFINESPVRNLWLGTSTQNSVLQRSFSNNSMMQFSFALTDADRIRGISTHAVSVDEYQDMDPGLLPIIKETMSASPYGLTTLTGTPKSLDTPLEGAWGSSSQAEWFIPCRKPGCGEWNIPSREYHIEKMIGPMHAHISEKYPGVVCHRCRHPINPRHGHWIHRYPDLRWHNAGYHVPQFLLPLHYADPERWATLIRKRNGWDNTTETQFWNEVLGVSVDIGQKLVTITDLKQASTLPWVNNQYQPDQRAIDAIPEYQMRTLAVDWGGGGEKGVSFTVLAVMGMKPDGELHVIWAKRLLMASDHIAEAREVIKWFRVFSCDNMVHDYTGAGGIREAVLAQQGMPLDRMIPVRLAAAAVQDLMTPHAPTAQNSRAWYSLDKTRSLLYTCQAIKTLLLRMFQYDRIDINNPGLMSDFLSLIENKTDTRMVGDIYTISRNPLNPDDFAQAVNLGANALWFLTRSWPNFAAATASAKWTEAQMRAAGSVDYGWEQDYSPENDAFNPEPY